MSTALLIKLGLYCKDHWKQIVPIVCGVLIFILLLPLFLTNLFLPSTNDEQLSEYKLIGEKSGMDWTDLIVYDTIRYSNDFSQAIPYQTPFEFLRVNLKQYETNIYYETDEKGKKVKVVEKVLIRSVNACSFNEIQNLLVSLGYNVSPSNMYVNMVTDFLEGLNGEDYIVTVDKTTIDDKIEYFDDDKKQWAFNLLVSLPLIFGEIKEVQDYYLPDGVVAFISPSPVPLHITSPFGIRTHPVTGKLDSMHFGIDLAKSGCFGEPVVSVADGVVTEVNYTNNLSGQYIRISHVVEGHNWQSRYCHLSVIGVKKGDEVIQGQTIGQIGNTGLSTAPHLHFELKYEGGYVDPALYVIH